VLITTLLFLLRREGAVGRQPLELGTKIIEYFARRRAKLWYTALAFVALV
jgi:hypothetical protein